MLNKLFFGIEVTWKKVVIFAVATAAFTALMLILPFTIHTSFSNIGTYLESWILFALIIIMNCKKPIEAALKTFVFFLISQPLIYLFQVPFSYLGWNIFMFYKQWFIITLLTLPGGYIAWYVKKDNILSALILSVACSILCYFGAYFLNSLIINFPHNLLSCIYCYVLAYLLIFVLLKNKKTRTIALIITTIAFIVSFLTLTVKGIMLL